MKNKNLDLFSIIILVSTSLIFLFGCSIETVEQYNSRISASSHENSSTTKTQLMTSEVTISSDVTPSNSEIVTTDSIINENSTDLDNVLPTSTSEITELPTTTPTEAITNPPTNQITVTLEIRCDMALENFDKLSESAKSTGVIPSNGAILNTVQMQLNDGESAFLALAKACKENSIQLGFSGSEKRKTVYVEGINGLYQGDCGPSSGWIYLINGISPNTSCSKYTLKSGDKLEFHFTDGSKIE